MKFLLYKFFSKEEYRQQFLDGVLYANKLSFYRNIENSILGVADNFENADIIAWPDHNHFVQNRFVEQNGEIYIHSVAYEKKPEGYIENQGFISFRHDDYNVFCMSSIKLNDDGTVAFFDKENQKSFGEYGVFISDTPAFSKRVVSSMINNHDVSWLEHDFVKYIDYETRDPIQQWTPFYKFSSFSSQQEYRFVFASSCGKALEYRVQPLDDIAICINSKAKFFNSINVGDTLCSKKL